MTGRFIGIGLILSVLLAAHADSLLLRDGDRLTGQLVKVEDHTIVFRTELAGQIIVPVDEVQSLTSKRSLVYQLTNGQTIPAKLEESQGQHILVGPDGRIRIPIQLADIDRTAGLPYATSADLPAESLLNPAWQVTGEIGVLGHAGTRDYVAPFARIALRGEGERFDFNSYLRFEMEETSGIPDHVRTALELNLRRDARWYPQLYAGIDRNIDEGRQMRADVGVGLEGRIYQSETSALTAGAGIGVAIERLNARHLIREGVIAPARVRTHEQENLDLRLQLRYTRDLYEGALWEKRVELFPSLTELGELWVRYESALWVPLTPRLKLKLDASVIYDNEPELKGLREWESTVGASVSLDF
jgi:hypothetical protein